MEVLFTLIKNSQLIQGLDILNYRLIYSAYAGEFTFFLRNIDSMKDLARAFRLFSSFFYFSPNLRYFENAGTRSLKGVKRAVCCMKNIDLTKESVLIIGISLSYNKTIKKELSVRTTTSKTQAVLNLWRM